MIHLMNSAVMPAGCHGTYVYGPATTQDLKDVMLGKHGTVKSSIGYPQNADLIEQWTGIRPEIRRAEIKFEDGDKALVMRLTKRVVNPAGKGSLVSSDPRDWEFAWVTFSA